VAHLEWAIHDVNGDRVGSAYGTEEEAQDRADRGESGWHVRPNLTPAALHALLASLQLLQHELTEVCADPDDLPDGIGDLLTHGGRDTPLSSAEIDHLCEALGTGEVELVLFTYDL